MDVVLGRGAPGAGTHADGAGGTGAHHEDIIKDIRVVRRRENSNRRQLDEYSQGDEWLVNDETQSAVASGASAPHRLLQATMSHDDIVFNNATLF